MTSRQRAACPVCGAMRAVGPNGTMWWHKGDLWKAWIRQACAGVGQSPKANEEEETTT